MFNKKAKAYTNQLTDLIKKNPEISVEEVFSHELLSVTIRNEAADFLDYVFKEENSELPNFDLIIEYALTDKKHICEGDDSENPLTFIINQNAANFLASPGKKLNERGNEDKKKRIFRALRSFIKKKYATNSMCAGNFSRIFLTWYNRNPEQFGNEEEIQNFYKDKFSIDKLIEFCVLNIKELSYSELLERFLTTDSEGQDNIRNKILYEILQKVRDIIGEKIKNDEMDDSTNSITLCRSLGYSGKVEKQLQTCRPLTWKYQQFPEPIYLEAESIDCGRPLNTNAKINTADLIPIVDKKIKWDEDEKKLFAYTLINTIWSASAESSTIFEFIQSQQPEEPFKNRKRILEYLLFIGVFGYENIMVSSTAFRILDVVVNGDPKLDITPLSKKDRLGSDDIDLVEYYADFVAFDSNNVSNLAVFSFPIFYNHVYSNLKAEEDSIVEYKFKDMETKYVKKETKTKLRTHKTNKKGLTPFVYMIPAVMTEPPLSTDLCNSYFKIFMKLYDERKELLQNVIQGIEDKEELKETVKKMIEIDKFYLDFVTYKFEYPGLEGKYNIVELTEKLFPLNPHYYSKTDASLDRLKISEKERKIINENAEKTHPLINYSFVKMTSYLIPQSARDSFFNSESGYLIPQKNVQQIPEYAENIQDGQDKIDLLYSEYNKIIMSSQDNRFKAGPRDENQEIDAS